MPTAMMSYCKSSEVYFRNSLDKIEKLRPGEREDDKPGDNGVDSSPSFDESVNPQSPSQSDSEDIAQPRIYPSKEE